MKQFNNEMVFLKARMTELQAQLNAVMTESDKLTESNLPLKFFNRVCTGELTRLFNDLAKATFEYQGQLKQALDQATAQKIAEDSLKQEKQSMVEQLAKIEETKEEV